MKKKRETEVDGTYRTLPVTGMIIEDQLPFRTPSTTTNQIAFRLGI